MWSLVAEIESYIKEMLRQNPQGWIEISRKELAGHFDCVPSQITYVVNTRFTTRHGYLVESRRGGSGYIRICRLGAPPPGAHAGDSRTLRGRGHDRQGKDGRPGGYKAEADASPETPRPSFRRTGAHAGDDRTHAADRGGGHATTAPGRPPGTSLRAQAGHPGRPAGVRPAGTSTTGERSGASVAGSGAAAAGSEKGAGAAEGGARYRRGGARADGQEAIGDFAAILFSLAQRGILTEREMAMLHAVFRALESAASSITNREEEDLRLRIIREVLSSGEMFNGPQRPS